MCIRDRCITKEDMENPDRMKLLTVLYITIFVTSLALGTVTFLLPVYIEELGGTYFDMGLIGAIGNIAYTSMTMACGLLLDRYEKIRLYMVFTVFSAFVVILFAFTENITGVIIMRALLGLCSATFWVTASTLTANISPTEELTRSMGRYNLSWISGFTVGPYLGGLITNAYGFQFLFLLLSSLFLVSIALIFFNLRGKIVLKNTKMDRDTGTIFSLKPILWAYLALFPFTLVLGIYMAILPGYMKMIGITASLIGLLLTLTNGVRVVGFITVERWVNLGTKKSMALAAILLTASMYTVGGASNTAEFALPLILYGVASGIITPVMLDYITKRASKNGLGLAMGAHEGTYGLGMLLGPMSGGYIAETYSIPTLFLLLTGVSLLILPVLLKLD